MTRTMIISFTIEGQAVPKSYGYNARGWYKSKAARDWEKVVGNTALLAACDVSPNFVKGKHTGPVTITATFYLPIPASDKKSIKMGDPHCRKSAGDLTNLWKSTEDGLKGVLFRDDGQVWMETLAKVYSDNPRVVIAVDLQ